MPEDNVVSMSVIGSQRTIKSASFIFFAVTDNWNVV